MADLFREIIPAIRETKEEVLDESNIKDYNPWLVNYALSFHMDTLFQANEMNLQPDLPVMVQYRYLMSSIRPMKRPFVPWPKKPKNEVLLAIMLYWRVSRSKAEEYVKVLTEDQQQELLKMWETTQDGKASRSITKAN